MSSQLFHQLTLPNNALVTICHMLLKTVTVFYFTLTMGHFTFWLRPAEINGKPICDFVLVIDSNFSRICYRFRDIHG